MPGGKRVPGARTAAGHALLPRAPGAGFPGPARGQSFVHGPAERGNRELQVTRNAVCQRGSKRAAPSAVAT
jgi:hypothetical protein